jgi:transcription elongation factor GreB
MSRYRAPAPPASKYITREGAQRLRAELDALWREERPRVTLAVSAAAAQGDRSENADYTYGKKRLREIDSRVRHLRQRLEDMTIVEQPATDRRRAFFGAWVTLEDETGATFRHRIVGPDEFDHRENYLSMDSPLGRALLGKPLDAEITLDLPAGPRTLVLVQIDYD